MLVYIRFIDLKNTNVWPCGLLFLVRTVLLVSKILMIVSDNTLKSWPVFSEIWDDTIILYSWWFGKMVASPEGWITNCKKSTCCTYTQFRTLILSYYRPIGGGLGVELHRQAMELSRCKLNTILNYAAENTKMWRQSLLHTMKTSKFQLRCKRH